MKKKILIGLAVAVCAGFLALFLLSRASSPEFFFKQGTSALQRKQYDKAITSLKKYVELPTARSKAPALANIGIAYGKQNRLDEAIVYFKKAIEADDQMVVGYVFLGRTYLQKKDWRPAIAVLSQGLRVAETKPDATLSLLHRDLKFAYDMYGIEYGVDKELVLRSIYHLEALMEIDPERTDDPKTVTELKRLISLAEKETFLKPDAQEIQIFQQNPETMSRIEAEKLVQNKYGDPATRLPEDNISSARKQTFLEKAKARFQGDRS